MNNLGAAMIIIILLVMAVFVFIWIKSIMYRNITDTDVMILTWGFVVMVIAGAVLVTWGCD